MSPYPHHTQDLAPAYLISHISCVPFHFVHASFCLWLRMFCSLCLEHCPSFTCLPWLILIPRLYPKSNAISRTPPPKARSLTLGHSRIHCHSTLIIFLQHHIVCQCVRGYLVILWPDHKIWSLSSFFHPQMYPDAWPSVWPHEAHTVAARFISRWGQRPSSVETPSSWGHSHEI